MCLFRLVGDHEISLPRGAGTSQFLSYLILTSDPLFSVYHQVTWSSSGLNWTQGLAGRGQSVGTVNEWAAGEG